MYLTKLIVVFGVILVAVLGQTEGRRNWLRKNGERIGCEGSKKSNFAIGEVSEVGDINSGHEARNDTEIHSRRATKWHKFMYGRTKGVKGNLSDKVDGNSTDSESNFDNDKVSRRSRIIRRRNFNGHQWKLNKIVRDEGSNVTRSNMPILDNEEGTNLRKSRKCRGRFGPRTKCQQSELPEIHEDKKELNESLLDNAVLPTAEQPKQNMNN